MYIVIEKTTDSAYFIKNKTALSKLVGISTRTILRNQNKFPLEYGNHKIYKDLNSKHSKTITKGTIKREQNLLHGVKP